MDWTTACPDWEQRILAKQSLIPFAPLFPGQAEQQLEVFKSLKVVDMAGSPTMGMVSRPWIFEFVAAIFGSYDAEAGQRLITEFFLMISKKNTKSTTAAGIMLTALLWNWRESAEFLILAPTKEIADNSFKPARDMVKADGILDALLHVQDNTRTITHRTTGAALKVVAADSDTVGGKKATGVLIDELWLLGKKPNAENMLLEATGGLMSRPEGFTIYLSTQSDQPPAGVFKQKLQYARDVRDGKIQDRRFLPVLYEFPEQMLKAKKYREKAFFYVTNPNLGASVDIPAIEREFTKAEHGDEGTMQGFLAKHLNVEIGLNLRSDRWAGADYWERQGVVKGITLEQLIARSEVIAVGIDGGGLDDLLGLGAVGRDKLTREWLVWTKAWAHPSVMERRKSEAARFADFAADGDLVLVGNMGDDVDQVAEIVSKIYKSGLLDKVGTDPAGLGGILDALVAAGVPQELVVGITQGWKMNASIKTAERKLAEGGMLHGAQRMMNWCVGNAKIEQHGNAVVITKQASGTAKIDPLLALLNAVTLMALNPEGRGTMDDWLSSPVRQGGRA